MVFLWCLFLLFYLQLYSPVIWVFVELKIYIFVENPSYNCIFYLVSLLFLFLFVPFSFILQFFFLLWFYRVTLAQLPQPLVEKHC